MRNRHSRCVRRPSANLQPQTAYIHCLFSMAVLRIPVVVPTKLDWLLMLCFIGLAGFGGQVCSLPHPILM